MNSAARLNAVGAGLEAVPLALHAPSSSTHMRCTWRRDTDSVPFSLSLSVALLYILSLVLSPSFSRIVHTSSRSLSLQIDGRQVTRSNTGLRRCALLSQSTHPLTDSLCRCLDAAARISRVINSVRLPLLLLLVLLPPPPLPPLLFA